METKKFIDFIITQKCTYNCAYCSQSKYESIDKNNADDKTIDSFLLFLDKIDTSFEITITGGEALLHPRFYEIIEKIAKKGFKINLISNFSFDIEKYKKIIDLLDTALNQFDISFHFDEIKDSEKNLEKIEDFIKYKNKNTKTTFLIPIFCIDLNKEKKIEKIQKLAKKYNIPVSLQHIRVLNQKIKYNNQDKKYFKNEKLKKTFSKLCHAGSKSAVIYEDGSVFRCYSSRFLKSNYLGNIKDENFDFIKNPIPCLQKYCTCPKPVLYNQIKEEKDIPGAYFLKIQNIFYLPFLIIKKRKIIKIKLKQYFNLRKNRL